eukprot:9087067-Alexandrium_andersonii.AAC.1
MVKGCEGGVVTDPAEIDRSMLREWGEVYAENGPVLETAASFLAKYQPFLPSLPQAEARPITAKE